MSHREKKGARESHLSALHNDGFSQAPDPDPGGAHRVHFCLVPGIFLCLHAEPAYQNHKDVKIREEER